MTDKTRIAIVLGGAILLSGLAHFLGTTQAQPPGWGPYPNGKTGGSTIINNNGVNLTNITYQYTTNPVTAQTFGWGKAYETNIAGNITALLTAPGATMFETSVLFITNSSASDFTITFPNGVWGTPGSGTPPVYYCTNKMLTRLMVEHYGQQITNAYKLDFAP